ncbi:MAG: CaiB/BaiF CoA-transferase family protein [Pseudomonadota bacterium]
MRNNTVSGLLSGVRVLDLSRILAGPWSTQFMAELGAEVIKVEKPGVGDDTRKWGPPFLEPATAGTDSKDHPRPDAAYFHCANRNKRSVEINFAKPEGAELIKKMAAQSDIFIENFKVGDLDRKGLGYEHLKAVNPKLVYCSVTGFGQDGPRAHEAGYDFIIQAMSGLMSITGERVGDPMKVGVAVSDLFAGLYATSSMLAALRHAEKTGNGQHIDVSLFDCQLAALANQSMNYLAEGKPPTRLGNAHPNIAPYEALQAKDGPFIVAIGNDDQFRAFCQKIGALDLAADKQFQTNAERVKSRETLKTGLERYLAKKSVSEWLSIFADAGIPAGPINTIADAFHDPQAVARGALVSTEETSVGHLPGHPVKYSGVGSVPLSASPHLGEGTGDIVSDYLSKDEIAEFKTRGIIGG